MSTISSIVLVGGADRTEDVEHFASKYRVEQRIATMDLPATVLRPVYFMG